MRRSGFDGSGKSGRGRRPGAGPKSDFATRQSRRLPGEDALGRSAGWTKRSWSAFLSENKGSTKPGFRQEIFTSHRGRTAAAPASAAGAPAEFGRRRRAVADRRSGPKNREFDFEEQGVFFRRTGSFLHGNRAHVCDNGEGSKSHGWGVLRRLFGGGNLSDRSRHSLGASPTRRRSASCTSTGEAPARSGSTRDCPTRSAQKARTPGGGDDLNEMFTVIFQKRLAV